MKTLRLLAFCLATVGYADSFTGKCVGVSDGDTVSVMKDGSAVKVRLNGIDCPESGQDFGAKAKKFTSDLAFGKEVRVDWSGKDRYDRILGTVYAGGKNVCEALVANGMAWHYVKYSDDKRLHKLESDARKAKAGVWSMPNSVPPWEFRKRKRESSAKGAGENEKRGQPSGMESRR